MPPIRVAFAAPLTLAGKLARLALALVVIVTLALGRPSADPAREVLVFVLVVGPFPLWLALRWLGDRGLVRGLFERPPPSVTLDEQTLELCLPTDGCRVFDLDAIAELRPRPGIRPSLLWSVPEGELIDRDGRIVARIPSAVVAPLGLRGASRPGLAFLLIEHGGGRFVGIARRRWLDGTRWPVRAS